MHPAVAAASSSPFTPPETVDQINRLLSLLLPASLSVKSFVGRWQVLRSKLSYLRTAVAEVSDSSHWADNPLLQTLLPNVLATLFRVKSLSEQCTDSSFNGGKLLMQSDLDMASSALSSQLHDLDLLLRSGVLLHSNAIVLSQPGAGADKDDVKLFVRELFTRLQIGGTGFKKKALEALLRLLGDDEKLASLVAQEGEIALLVHLLDINADPCLREQAATAVALLATASDFSRKSVFEHGGLGPLLRMIENGSSSLKEKAAMAVEAITAEPEHAWAVSAYGGVSVLVEACRSGTPGTQSHAVGAIKNVAAVEDFRNAVAEEGGVAVLLRVLMSGACAVQEKAAEGVAALVSSGGHIRTQVLRERGLQKLMLAFQESPSADTMEHVLRAITSLSASDSVYRTLSSSTAFVVQLGEVIRRGGSVVSLQISAMLLSRLSVSDGNKRAIAGSMGSLVRLMEAAKPAGLPEAAAQALASLLTVRSNRKELARDEKSLGRLVRMLDPKNEGVGQELAVMVVTAMVSGGSEGTRGRVLAAGAQPHLRRLAEAEVAGAKRALQKLAGSRLKSIFSKAWKE